MSKNEAELREAIKDGLSNHTGEFLNPWLIKGKWAHEQLAEVLEAVLSSKRMIKNLNAYAERQSLLARKDELGGVQLDYGHRLAQTFINGEAMTVQERYDQLTAQLNTLEKGEE